MFIIIIYRCRRRVQRPQGRVYGLITRDGMQIFQFFLFILLNVILARNFYHASFIQSILFLFRILAINTFFCFLRHAIIFFILVVIFRTFCTIQDIFFKFQILRQFVQKNNCIIIIRGFLLRLNSLRIQKNNESQY